MLTNKYCKTGVFERTLPRKENLISQDMRTRPVNIFFDGWT